MLGFAVIFWILRQPDGSLVVCMVEGKRRNYVWVAIFNYGFKYSNFTE